MFYIEKEDRVRVFDESLEKLLKTINNYFPQYQDLEIKRLAEGYTIDDFKVLTIQEAEAKKAEKEKKRTDTLTLTPSDVERALYKAKKMNFEMLKEHIKEKMPDIDMIALDIEFRATTFHRGATFGEKEERLFDVIGAMLGYTTEDMDYLFLNKSLPEKSKIN